MTLISQEEKQSDRAICQPGQIYCLNTTQFLKAYINEKYIMWIEICLFTIKPSPYFLECIYIICHHYAHIPATLDRICHIRVILFLRGGEGACICFNIKTKIVSKNKNNFNTLPQVSNKLSINKIYFLLCGEHYTSKIDIVYYTSSPHMWVVCFYNNKIMVFLMTFH